MTKEDLKNYIQTAEELNNKENNKFLLSLYGWLIPRNDWTGEVVNDYDYSYTLMDDFPIGWRKAFGWEMINEINDIVEEYHLDDFYPIQIKEKFGGLRFYTVPTIDLIYKIINKYEKMSYRICIECGKPAKWVSTGWISPWCDEHKDKKDIPIEDFYNDFS